MKSQKTRRIISNAIIYFILALMTVIWLAPIVWMVLQAFAGEGYSSKTKLIPDSYTFNHFLYLFSNWTGVSNPQTAKGNYEGLFPTLFANTLIIAVLTTIISTIFVLGTAYALSRFRFRGRKAFMKINLIIGMFPGFLNMILIYWMFKDIFHLTGTYWSLVIIYSAGAGGNYYISKGFFDTISKSIDEAAMIDGASRSQIFWKIILPLSKPIVIYTVLTSFMSPWGEYVTSSYIIGTNQSQQTVAIGLYNMINDAQVPAYYNQFAAGSIVVAIPICILFFCLQKYYVSGVTGGAVKG